MNAPKDAAELFAELARTAASDQELYRCQLCRDTGWLITAQGAQPCSCGRMETLILRRRMAGLASNLDHMRFAQFDLRYYTLARQTEEGLNYRQAAERALKAAKVFVAALVRQETPRGLYLEGKLGSGKTFLAASIANALVDRNIDVRFVVVPEFLDQLRLSYRPAEGNDYNEGEMMKRALQARVLILDDLGAHNSSQWTINKIYTLLNHRLNNQLPCIITTNLQPKALAEELGSRTASRIREMCDRYLLLADEDIRGVKPDGGKGW